LTTLIKEDAVTKRMAAVFVLLALVCVAQAQSQFRVGNPNDARKQPESTATRASPGAAIFYLLMTGNAAQQRPMYWAERLQDSSLTPGEVDRLQAYGKYARETNLAFQKAEREKLCAVKGALTTLDTVAAALTQFDAANSANIEQLGNEAAGSLGDRLGKLLAAAGHKSTFMVSDTDHKQMMAIMKKEPVAHIQSFCSKSSSSPAP
jgi:hypothetical protein